MATRLVHVSDLHFPARNRAQVDALVESIKQSAPDLIVVTGDLTRAGRDTEFREATDFMAALPGPRLVVPGNHDVPVPGLSDRLCAPFGRFQQHFPSGDPVLETPDMLVVGMTTAMGIQLGWDWSLGNAGAARVDAVCGILRQKRDSRLAIVACHHPLRPNPLDRRRSRTRGGEKAFDKLAAAGMGLLLHGHLHRATTNCREVNRLQVCEICANTALSDRPRGGSAGYNILDVQQGTWNLTVATWSDGRYRAPATA
ncbi:MAG TPA: metallophosphoesterase [Rhizomicrobium sp.]